MSAVRALLLSLVVLGAFAAPAQAAQNIDSFEVETTSTSAGAHPDLVTRFSLEESDEDDEEEDEPRVAPIPLGHIVRYERDRVHPDSLPLEAVDLLQKIIEGKTSEVVDRALADLLGL